MFNDRDYTTPSRNPAVALIGALLPGLIIDFPQIWTGWSLKSVAISMINRALFLGGLILCGPIRTFALTVPLALISSSKLTLPYRINFGHYGNNNSTGEEDNNRRGIALISASFILLAFFDYDEHVNNVGKASSLKHAFHHLFHHYGMSDHKVGLVLLLLFAAVNRSARVDITSQWIGSSIMMIALCFSVIFNVVVYDSLIEFAIGMIVGLFLFPANKLCRMICKFPKFSKLTYISIISIGCLFQKLLIPITLHPITLSCCVAIFLLMSGSGYLMSDVNRFSSMYDKKHKLYSNDFINTEYFESNENLSAPCLMRLLSYLQDVLSHKDSRTIFYFLCLNLSFTFVEMFYGLLTNSLGLLSDGFHMLFDCTALILGLYASLVSRKPRNKVFTYGYGRAEILAGYINGLFLVIVGMFVLIEGISRLFHPPEIISEQLLPVSIIGLIINLVGVYSFGHLHHGCGHHHHHDNTHSHASQKHDTAHEHKAEHGENCPHSHTEVCEHNSRHVHSHSFNSHDHCDDHNHGHSHTIGNNANIKGVFLHILADTLGSVGVIVSSFLIKKYQWNIADPICSLFIASLILLSVLPMLYEAAESICLRIPRSHEKQFYACISKISRLPGVIGCRNASLWSLTSDQLVGSLSIVLVNDNAEFDRSKVNQIIDDLLPGNNQIYIQILTHQTNDNSFKSGTTYFNNSVFY
ncbi:hypothetical protein GJ496_008692 [Pomphorhynchus laevis]|nr:hypothetical protein GJ496_008692 [Pomphorhynchus laevis]